MFYLFCCLFIYLPGAGGEGGKETGSVLGHFGSVNPACVGVNLVDEIPAVAMHEH